MTRLRDPYRVGANVWYLLRDGGVLKVRRGRVEEIGLANRSLIHSRRAAVRFLTSFSNRAR